MQNNYQIAPSILNADFARLKEAVKAVESGGAGIIHLDVMDGNFVPNISFGPCVVDSIRKVTKLPLDCHLMIDQPEKYISDFIQAGADSVTIQVESTLHLDRCLQLIREQGKKTAVTLNPATPLSCLDSVLDTVDMVLIMSVNPGFGGQALIPYTLEKVRQLRSLKPDLNIQIDGGIKLENIARAKEAGANNFVVGSAIFGTPNPEQTCRDFVRAVQ
jgi:ribulose-phosphate 3-epimerase